MDGRYLLDTNVAIRVLNREVDLETRRDHVYEVFLCVTVVGELLYGAAHSGKPAENRERIGKLLEICPVVPHDIGTARRYGEVKAALRSMGRPIPENDTWVAASALQHDLTLAALDRHFEHVGNLQVESW